LWQNGGTRAAPPPDAAPETEGFSMPTIRTLLLDAYSQSPSTVAVRWKADHVWHEWSFVDLHARARAVASALAVVQRAVLAAGDCEGKRHCENRHHHRELHSFAPFLKLF
jgi:hypothetical protein